MAVTCRVSRTGRTSFFFFFYALKRETASEIVKQIFKLSQKQEKSVPERLPALMNTSWFITLGEAHRIVSLLRGPSPWLLTPPAFVALWAEFCIAGATLGVKSFAE